ncbi:MAG: hypothetical protein NUV80_02475 [Candidatus Berkelbacteria bacterium]|nr:hypothetical protein [Candidatus Berkelbacteria bacterium]MCR4307399.1 hypothetical protein [Candidatus Berkelbacteria bacterium]
MGKYGTPTRKKAALQEKRDKKVQKARAAEKSFGARPLRKRIRRLIRAGKGFPRRPSRVAVYA